MLTFSGEYNVRHGYVIPDIPQIISTNELGIALYGEDPGNIIDEVIDIDQVEKLTQ